MTIKIAPSILSADFACLEEEIKKSEKAGVDGFHLDIMDGHFVPNITIGPFIVNTIRQLTKLSLDAHLMIDNPDLYIEDFAGAGADIITLHLESYDLNPPDVKSIKKNPRTAREVDMEKLIFDLRYIKSLGKKAGLSLNPGTAAELLDPYLLEADEILIMSVNPGFSGQKFMPEVIPKIKSLRVKFKGNIRIDGGINHETAKLAVKAGVDILVSASYIYKSGDYKEAVRRLRSA